MLDAWEFPRLPALRDSECEERLLILLSTCSVPKGSDDFEILIAQAMRYPEQVVQARFFGRLKSIEATGQFGLEVFAILEPEIQVRTLVEMPSDD